MKNLNKLFLISAIFVLAFIFIFGVNTLTIKATIDNDSATQASPKFKGYIIQYEDKSIVEKKKELEKKAKPELEVNLKYKDRGEDVKNLQEMLKNDPAVYPEGLVTGYFGPLTNQAVIRFQEKYAQDILAPWKLTRGTGFVGSTTRQKLNSLYVLIVDVSKELKTYSESLKSNNQRIKQEILSKIKIKASTDVLGVISSQTKIKNEFSKVINGIVLDISLEESEEVLKILGVKSVYPNYEVQAVLMDSIPLIHADYSWNLGYTGDGITIAIIDTGIDYSHLDLGGCSQSQFLAGNCQKVIGGYDFVTCSEFLKTGRCISKPEDDDPMDDEGHGTHVAGIAAGSGLGGLKGVAPDAKLYAYKVLNKDGSGLSDWIIAGIERAVDPNQDGDFSDHVDIISMSLGGYGHPDDPMSTVIDNVVDLGVTAVIAAGNSGPGGNNSCFNFSRDLTSFNTICSPGVARKAITVGATFKKDYQALWWDCTPGEDGVCGYEICPAEGKIQCDYWGHGNPLTDQVTSFSSRGPVKWGRETIIKPDIVAPGAIICSASSAKYNDIFSQGEHPYYHPCLDEEHIQIAGTSMAAPIVSGAVALLKQKYPDWSPEEIKTTLINSAVDLGEEESVQGYGRIDILKAFQLKAEPPIADIKTKGVTYSKDIIGTASGGDFKEYKLYYGEGKSPSQWQEIKTGTELIENGILYENFNAVIPSTISFKLVVWNTADETSQNISTVIFAEVPVGKELSAVPANKLSHFISGDKIVWTDNRNVDYDIYMYDLLTNQERQVTKNVSVSNPTLSKNKIVWNQRSSDILDSRDIYMCDLNKDGQEGGCLKNDNKKRAVFGENVKEYHSFISDNILLWRKNNNSGPLYMCNLNIYPNGCSYNSVSEEETSNVPSSKIGIRDISNNNIVYWCYYGYNKDICMYNLSTKQETQLTVNLYSEFGSFSTLRIFGDKIVWAYNENKRTKFWDIYMCDLGSNIDGNFFDWCSSESKGLRQITSNSSNQKNPSIFENKIIWQGVWQGDRDGDWDIYMCDLARNGFYGGCLKDDMKRRITTDAFNQTRHQISGNRVIWADDRDINTNIYVYELPEFSPESICLDIDGDGFFVGGGDECLPTMAEDCDDSDPNIYPRADEICFDGYDNDCDGLIDDLDASCGGFEGIKITNCAELQDIDSNLNNDYRLINDIDCSETINLNNGLGFETIGKQSNRPFKGTLDGQGYKITNLHIVGEEYDDFGLFSYCDNCQIINLGLENININVSPSSGYIGGLVGVNSSGTITDSYSTGNASATEGYVGGLIAGNWKSAVSHCYSISRVTGPDMIAGFVAYGYSNCSYLECFWDSDINPDVNSIGNREDDPNVTDLPTTQMQDPNTYTDAGWDFNTPIWKFCSLPDYPKLGWEECPEAATLLDVVSTMLDPNSLKNSNMKNALINKINAVLQMIDEGLNEEALTKMASVGSVKANRSYNGALNKLENDILAKTDGCAETGEPDKNDWITSCEGQNQVYPLIMETIEYVRSLME